MTAARILREGLDFGEGPRWRDGRLWFSDFYRHAVYTLDESGQDEQQVLAVPGQPSGLGWLPDGSLLVVSMLDRKVLKLIPGGSEAQEYADLSGLADYHANDLVTDAEGGAYVGNFGYDLHEDIRTREIPVILADEVTGVTRLARIAPHGSVSSAAEGMRFPNGMVLIDEGRTLVVAETTGLRLTAFDVTADGGLSNRRVWASTAEQMVAPDGICADPQGGVWVSAALGNAVVRYAEGGEVTGMVETSQIAYACALGGDDGRTLFVMTAPSSDPHEVDGQRLGRIEVATV